MPRYKGVLTLEDEGPDTPVVHLFDYSSEGDQAASKSHYKKQVIAVEPCIYLGRRNLAAIKTRSRPSPDRNTTTDSQSATSTENNADKSTNGEAAPETEKTNTKEQKEEMKEQEQNTKEEQEEKKEDVNEKEKKNVKEAHLKEGQEFQGYILKCPNGPYDYAMKLWDTGRAAPPEADYPKEGQEVAALVVDRADEFLVVACGPNIAFARRKAFLCAGVDPDDLSLPFARLKVSLRRLQEREALVPAAGWEASPTQIVVPPYDIY